MTEESAGKVTQRELYDEISAVGAKVETGFQLLRTEIRSTYTVSAVCDQRHKGVDNALASLATSTEAARIIAAASIEEARVTAAASIEEARITAIKPVADALAGAVAEIRSLSRQVYTGIGIAIALSFVIPIVIKLVVG